MRVVTDIDTAKDAWSIASGNYSSRFAPAVAGAAHLAATRLRERLARIAAAQLNARADDLLFAGGKIHPQGNADNTISFTRLAASSHWAPGTLPSDLGQAIRETVFWTPPELTAPTEADEINSSLCHGFIFDYCGVEVDRESGQVHIDRYVTMHDCGRVLHPGMVAGQVTGGFAHALGAALFEEHAYGADGSFRTGTFADYLVPTAMEVPEPVILHHETRSPFTPLGAKGVGEGNCMSTPVCIANAVADALGLAELSLPLLPARLAEHLHGPERVPERHAAEQGTAKPGERALFGEGSATVAAPRERLWAMLLDPEALARIIPGAHGVERLSETHFRAEVTLGIGPVKGRYRAEIRLSDLDAPRRATLTGSAEGALGFGRGAGYLMLEEVAPGRTTLAYRYEAAIGGKIASIGGRLLERTLGVMPLYHTMGVRSLLAMSLIGGCFVCLPRFEPTAALALIEAERVTNLYLVPTLYHDLVSHPGFARADIRSVRKLGFAGAPMTDGLLRRLTEAFQPELFVNHYGSSEVYTCTIDQNAAAKPGSAGRSGLNQRIRVARLGATSAEERAVPGEEGEIVAFLAGDEAFEGYWRRPEANATALRGGWFFTGDTGTLDADGDLFVTGRVDDMIITGGENVSPVEVESCLSLHPAVAEVAVAGLPDERWGKIVAAFVTASRPVTAEELDQHCRESGLANFKRPRRIVFVRDIPKSPVGKLLRRKLASGDYDPAEPQRQEPAL